MIKLLKILIPLIPILLIAFSQNAHSQAFVDAGAALPGISKGVCLWGDYDSDHDPDILISGKKNDGSLLTAIYTNTGGTFTLFSQEFPGLDRCRASWVDLENDGDLDFSLTGYSAEGKMYVFRNDGDSFSEISHGIEYYGEYSDLAWGDFDNDGDADLIISGNWQTTIYFNEGDYTFTGYIQDFAQLSSSRVSLCDADSDMDIDIHLSGDTGGGMASYLYLNNSGSFQQSAAVFTGLSAGSSDWGDYDSDGDADLIITGFDDIVSAQAFIYRNNGDLSFSKVNAGLTPVSMGNAAWADYDTDGDLDFMLTGKVDGCGTFVSQVYQNEGSGIFSTIYSGLLNAEYSFGSWADYDGDGDPDIVLCGSGINGSFTKVYRNDSGLPDFQPTAPQNLSAGINGNSVSLSWDKATDMETTQDGLSYNLRIATQSGGSDIMSPCSMEDGTHLISRTGNTFQNNSWYISNLEAGNYYWSVQAIDNSFVGSVFSDEESFTIYATYLDDPDELSNDINISANSNGITVINNSVYPMMVSVYNLNGSKLGSGSVQAGFSKIFSLPRGVYPVSIMADGKSRVEMICVE